MMTSKIAKFFGLKWLWSDLPCDGGRNDTRVDSIVGDNQSDLRNAQLQPENKRRKVQASLCLNPDHVNKIMGWLEDDDVATIGIYGMGGVGKTTLATKLRTRLTNHGVPFNVIRVVGCVSVGVDFTIYQLQQKVAGAFKIDLRGDEDKTRRAAIIHTFLSHNDKCVLILDDLWGDFRREDVGIPRHCRLILISRSRDVCRVMSCEKVLKVEPLSKEKTWELFQHSIGECVLEQEVVSRIGQLLYDKCAGLPLAITELAKKLRKMVDDNASSWREVFGSADPFSTGSTHLEDTFSQLKLSYERLNDVKLQRCFLYTAVFPKGYAINREMLIRLWIGERLIDDVLSLQAQDNMGHTILNKLLNSCLLEECEDDESRIKIHDLVRHMAHSIAGDSFMIEGAIPTELGLRENLRVVSLIDSAVSRIPSSISSKYHGLSTLLLQHNPLELIPESLFLQMRALRVLNLSDTRISRVPSSIDALEELRVLDLSFCKNLKQVASLSKLLKLQFLDLTQTAIGQVPCSVEKLKRLKELNLSSIPEPTKIPGAVLLALCMLKKLACHVIGTIHELQKMKSLEILDARFSSLCDLSAYVRSEHWCILESYHLQIGYGVENAQPYSRRVSLQGCLLNGHEHGIVLPSNIEELYVNNCIGFRSLSGVLYPLAYDHINSQNCDVFSSLEVCKISRCHDVETLFAVSWMENLQSLELLQVEDCERLKEVIAEEVVEEFDHSKGKHSIVSFTHLRRLTLTRLPQLKSIYNGQLVCAALQSCTFMDCPKLTRLPFSCMDDGGKLFSSRLELIEGQEKWWELLEWDHSKSKALLKPLFRYKSFDG